MSPTIMAPCMCAPIACQYSVGSGGLVLGAFSSYKGKMLPVFARYKGQILCVFLIGSFVDFCPLFSRVPSVLAFVSTG